MEKWINRYWSVIKNTTGLNNKVILITGCSSGFGFEMAGLLAKRGHTVYAGVRDTDDLRLVDGKNIYPVLLDVTWNQEKISELIHEIINKEGKIDVLVNNAGFGILGLVGSFNENEIKEQFETNLFGQFKMAKAVLPGMRKQRRGLIINISSVAGLHTSAFYGVYSSSKFALEAITAAMRVEESLYGIDVVSVNPGSYTTKFWENVKFPAEFEPLNNIIAAEIQSKLARFRANPMNVAYAVEKIINTPNPKKNYLVGLGANLIYYGKNFVPNRFVDWFAKLLIRKLVKRIDNQ